MQDSDELQSEFERQPTVLSAAVGKHLDLVVHVDVSKIKIDKC